MRRLRLGKSSRQPYPKQAKNDVTLPFQLVAVDVQGELRPGALGGFKFVSKSSTNSRSGGRISSLRRSLTPSLSFSSISSTSSSRQGTVWGESKEAGAVSLQVRPFDNSAGKLAPNSNSPLPTRLSRLAQTSVLGEPQQVWCVTACRFWTSALPLGTVFPDSFVPVQSSPFFCSHPRDALQSPQRHRGWPPIAPCFRGQSICAREAHEEARPSRLERARRRLPPG